MNRLLWILQSRKVRTVSATALVTVVFLWKVLSTSAQEAPRSDNRLSDFSLADVRLTRQVRTALANDEQLKEYLLSATVQNQVALVKGNVPTSELAKRVEVVVRTVPGITRVENECFVVPSPDTAPAEVAAAARREREMQSAPAPVDSGDPQLTGRNLQDRLPVPERKEGVDPNERVVGKPALPTARTTVLFHPDLSGPEPELAEVLDRLRMSESRTRDLRIEVKEGVVRVSGMVTRHADAWDFADRIAKVSGVKQVIVGKVEEK